MGYLIIGLWLSWFGYWVYSGRSAKKPEFKATINKLIYSLPLAAAYLLLLIPVTNISFPIAGTIVTAIGFAIACWARHELGRNWSAGLTIQHNHRLVTTGLYRYFKHPIYIGMVIAFAGTALFEGGISLFSPVFAAFALFYKARIEEQQLVLAFPDYTVNTEIEHL